MELLIGVLGAGLVLVAFILNQLHIWKDTDRVYDWVNVVGSLLLIAYALLLNSFPFAVLNLVWLLVSLRDVLQPQKKKKSSKRKG